MNRRFNDLQDCAHGWAHQHADSGKASNLSFTNACIYSYGTHFPIAYLDGNQVYFTLHGYSKSTSNHKNIVLSAISHKNIVYVYFVPQNAQELNSAEWIDKNVQHWLRSIGNLLQQLAAHPRKKSLEKTIHEEVYRLNAFYTAIGTTLHPDVHDLLKDPSIASIEAFVQNEATVKAARILKNYRLAVKQWRKGERQSVPYFDHHSINNDLAYLRINPATSEIETSKGIKVPFETGRRFWQYIQRVLPGGCVHCNYTIMRFDVSEISANQIVVGCHTIPMTEAKRIARKLGWLFDPLQNQERLQQ